MKGKFFLMLVGIVSLVLIATGCESNGGSAHSGKVTLTILAEADSADSLKAVAKGYEEKHPNVTVKVQSYPFADLFKQQQVVLNAHDPSADILYIDGPTLPDFASKGWIEPLDNYIDDSVKKEWSKSMADEVTIQGKLYAAPMNSSSQVLFYNKEILKKNGIEPPENDVNKRWTWEKLVNNAKKVKGKSNGQKVWGFAFEQANRAYQLIPLAQSLGATKLVSDDGLKSSGYTNSKEMIKAGQFMNDLYNTWKITPKISADQTNDYFSSGKLAFIEGGSWDAVDFKKAGVNFGIAPVPYFSGGKPVTPTGSWTLGVSKYSKNKSESAKLIKYMSTGEGAKKWFDLEGNLPATTHLLEQIQKDPKYKKLPYSASSLAAYEDQHDSMLRPKTPGYITWESEVDKAFENIMDGTDPKKALDESVKQMDNELEKYKN
ncbi:sugar ABC transporter substrate-binding protein [Pullulanibacillus camelliae]|uniref:Sugar ABC transporter substrate-binding protein n=1 Tax=Pullulanibacillus camelliae TaxID=1707096 RepID=A0A8J2VDN8_9BACL|nr:sugar ABC transporter substrate-binding protein [Pullulanibacillus camelliae]GGE27844.1 sugar ABC transporter substrate-binding protein [Pullulanibacillus camelliae]